MKVSRHNPGPNPFRVGAVVAVERGGNDEPYVKMVVATVQKNGNVRLAMKATSRPEPQQYRNYGNALQSTGSSFGRTIVRPWTPAIEAEQRRRIEKYWHLRRCRAFVGIFSSPMTVDADFVKELATLVAHRVVEGFGQ